MKYGIIQTPVTDLHKKPEFYGERLSQALFATLVTIHSQRNGYVRVTLPEGYSGWANINHVCIISQVEWRKYQKSPKAFIASTEVSVRDEKGLTEPYKLFFGTELAFSKRKSGLVFLHPSGDYSPDKATVILRKSLKPAAGSIIKMAKRFLGVPYLWGGITPYGYDCSGLVQIVYRMHGVELPRDSSRQMKVGEKIPRAELRKGDLLYFKGHVAISLGGDNIIHASGTRGMTVIESLNRDDTLYRKDLDEGFLLGRRVI